MQKQENHSQAAILGLQHLLAMYSGSILVPIMIAGALGYNAQQLTYLISTDIFMCGVATFLQLQLNKHFGIGLPVVLGVAFQSVAPLSMIGDLRGSGLRILLENCQPLPIHCDRICHYDHWFDLDSSCDWEYGKQC